MKKTLKKILIAGIGNKLRGDDGFGPRVVELLSKEKLPENVELADYGTAGFMLASDLEDYDLAIFADILQKKEKSSDLQIIELNASDIDSTVEELITFSLHEARVEEMLIFARKIGTLPEKIMIIGCEPENLELKLGLSPRVEELARKAVEIILDKIKSSEAKFDKERFLDLQERGNYKRER